VEHDRSESWYFIAAMTRITTSLRQVKREIERNGVMCEDSSLCLRRWNFAP
jgi:hypothetical protein